jgi:hypothetical protein
MEFILTVERRKGTEEKGDVYDFMLFFNPYIEILGIGVTS